MVGVFRKTLSFNQSRPRPSNSSVTHHTRSVSLPCRSHPLVAHLKEEISGLKSWSLSLENRTSAWLCNGLNRLKDLHDSFDDLLQMPQTQLSLRRYPILVENLLEDFLRFVDVYGCFRSSIMAFKEDLTTAQLSLRKKDDSKSVLFVKSCKQIVKEVSKLMSTVRTISTPETVPKTVGDAIITGIIAEVVEATVDVTTTIFQVISSSFVSRRSPLIGFTILKKEKKVEEGIAEFVQIGDLKKMMKKNDEDVKMALKKFEELEICVGGIESCSDKLYRSLIKSRVSLLNTQTQK